MKRIFRRRTIYSPDLPDDPYLDRWTLFSCRWFQVLLHRFHRSDNAAVHDHPWSFASLVLWRGYREFLKEYDPPAYAQLDYCWPLRRWPLSLAFRRAEDRHRVELIDGKRAWTLVITGARRRTWYFYPHGVRVPWRVLTEFGEAAIDRQIASGAREAYFEGLDRLLRDAEAFAAAAD